MTIKLKLFVKNQLIQLKTKIKSKKLERQIYLDSAETFSKHLHLVNEHLGILNDQVFKLENEDEYNG